MEDAMTQSGRSLRRLAWIAGVAALAGAGAAWGAGAPVALVMQVSGTTEPALARNREVADGTSIRLAPQSKLALLHYGTCAIVTLNGGTAKVTAQGVDAPAANVESTKPGPCPKTHRISLAEGTASGGVSVSRSVGAAKAPATAAPLNVSASGTVVLTGPGAERAQSYELRDGFGRAVGKPGPIKEGSFTLDGTQSANGPYTIRITFAGRPAPLDVQVFLSRGNDGGVLVLQTD